MCVCYHYVLQDLQKGIQENTSLIDSILQMANELKPQHNVQSEAAQLKQRWHHVQDKANQLNRDLEERSPIWQEYDDLKRQMARWLDMQESIVGRECSDYTGNSTKLEEQLNLLQVGIYFLH